MEDVKIGDQYLIGYNDFCLTSVNAIVFNKDIMAEYNLTAPYEDVRNKTWTMDKLISLASNVAKDNGDGVWNEKDTYGISGWGWVDTISFTTACDIKIVDRDETGLYQVAYENNSEKTFAALEKVNELYNGDFAYYKGPQGTKIPFNDGTTMMYTMETYYMTNLRDVTFHFGVLPYPMYNEAQGEYKSLNWNGVMFVPASIKDPEMVGDVLELLAYYTPPVQKAYYEDLLGSKLSDAPEDAEMLDVIWDSVVTDIGMVSANLAGMDPLLYMFPNLCMDGVQGYSSYVTRNTRSANRALEKLFG
jgi:ABC-type glycerol-3-phosphate transport system substrate-binding protein